ncbi:MAG TPA: Flp pilus assembly protein CpaB [Polyangia bacterium]|nr:Flp pilus assembly protein CpaB [Polyangia bacterium]
MAIDDIISTNSKSRREAGSQRSASRALGFGVFALVAGISVAALLKSYVDSHSAAGPAMSAVVVATMDLPLATTLQPEHLKVMAWPSGARPEGTFGDPKELVGRVLVAKMFRSEAFLDTKLADRAAGSGLAALIPESMRAAAVRVDDVVGVAGFIHPEDRVDVIVTMRPEQGGETASKVILQNVRVLAVGKEIEVDDQKRNKVLPVTVATLLVTTDQSEALALASAQGKLLLTLRGQADKTEPATAGIAPTALMGTARPRPSEPAKTKSDERPIARVARPAVHVAVAPPPAPASARGEVVEILRGDRFEQRKFDGKDAQ